MSVCYSFLRGINHFNPIYKTYIYSYIKHFSTSGMRQGNDRGTQYRSGIYYYKDEHRDIAETSKEAYQEALKKSGHGKITTEILKAKEFYYAEDYHQQYLHKNPNGYCGMGGTGVSCPIGLGKKMANKDEL